MPFQDLMSKIRHWDNLCARWMMRHFYILFFEIVLVIIFFIFFFNTIRSIDVSTQVAKDNIIEQILMQQTTNSHLIIVLMLLNSFWMLYVFNEISRIRLLLKEINFHQSRRKSSG